MHWKWMVFALIPLLLFTGQSYGEMKEPWKAKANLIQTRKTLETSPVKLALYGYLSFYSNYITLADGDRCPMYPTDAEYSRLAIKKHGFLMGIILTADRLLHEADEQKRAPVIVKYGVSRFYDPVEANDYWWYKPEKKDVKKGEVYGEYFRELPGPVYGASEDLRVH